jgi:hypothetical protein
MVLQGYFDDSGSDGKSPLYALAGFLAGSEEWHHLSEEWNERRKKYPQFTALHTTEAYQLKGEFASGWTMRLVDQMAFEFAELIKKYVKMRISVTLERKWFDHYLKGRNKLDVLSDPYFLCFFRIIEMTARNIDDSAKSVDLIFDKQGGTGATVLDYWDEFKKTCSSVHEGFARPIFRSDTYSIPLQAADLFSWHLRTRVLINGLGWQRKSALHLDKVLGSIPSHVEVIQPLEIEDIAMRFYAASKVDNFLFSRRALTKAEIVRSIEHREPDIDLLIRRHPFTPAFVPP